MYPTAIFNFPASTLPYHNVRSKPHTVVASGNNVALKEPSSTAQDGDYKVKPSEILQSSNATYEVLEFIGRGTFGQVVKCLRKDSGELVAIKILKNHPNYARQGQVEIQILAHLSSESSDKHNFVKALECFKHQNHTCLVFEILEKNLFDYLKTNKYAPMPLNHIRPILQQVLIALIKLAELDVIHADIKPENIMLVNPSLEPFRVKLIDFGSATYTSRALDNTYLQSRYYRAPEVILGVPFTEKIDIWSLGCVIAELFLGYPLYPGGCEFDQIRFITTTEGLPPKDMLDQGKKSRHYFVPPAGFCSSWRLKSEDEYALETGRRPKDTRKYKFKRLQELVMFGANDAVTDLDKLIEEKDRRQFIDLLIRMLYLDPELRCSPIWCKSHEFVTMNHLKDLVQSKRVRQGIEVMQRACQREKQPLNRMLLSQQQQMKYLQLQAVNQVQQREQQLHQQLKAQQQQHELNWSLHGGGPSTSLQYYITDNLQNLAERQAGIYPTPDWSPATTDWNQPEYGSAAHPIVISDSPNTRPVTSEQILQEHFYKTQLLRNALKQSTLPASALDLTSQYINPQAAVTLPNSLTLSGLSNVLSNRYL